MQLLNPPATVMYENRKRGSQSCEFKHELAVQSRGKDTAPARLGSRRTLSCSRSARSSNADEMATCRET